VRLLLDTHVVLWEQSGVRTVGPKAEAALQAATELLFSVVSFAEIGVKCATGKLEVPVDLRDRVVDGGVRILGLAPDHGLRIAELPLHHRDPFDRLLVSQARCEGLTLLTADPKVARYDVPTINAAR
jgi:PIN domain nuclease of toxin-antitoxin system